MQNQIFSIDSAKAIKSQAFGWLNAIHYMAPGSLSGVNLCPHMSVSCFALCLGWQSGYAGMVKHDADMNAVRQSRIDKARRFMETRQAYLADMVKAIHQVCAKAYKLNMKPCFRLNGSTDIAWEGIKYLPHNLSLYDMFPYVQFVEYTKNKHRMLKQAKGLTPANLWLTFSRSETNEADCLEVLAAGGNVAVVFHNRPETWNGYPVIDGDTHDLRHLDPRGGYVIGLSPKGRKAKRDTSGFVVR